MLIARLLNYIRNAKMAHVFLLEILAVFIGITGSLFVDNWRSEQADLEVLDHLLQETHYNALQDESYLSRLLMFNSAGLESSLTLAYEDLDEIPDSDLLRHFSYVMAENWWLDLQPGYQRLLNTSLSIPFDNTIAELDWHFRNLINNIDSVRDDHGRVKDAAIRLARLAKRPADLTASNLQAATDDAVLEQIALYEQMAADTGYMVEVSDTDALRSALQSEPGKAILRELIGYRYNQQLTLINATSSVQMIVRTIRKYDADITLPIGSIGILGDAAGIGWNESVPMTPSSSDPNVWIIEITLTDGEVKFRADNDWSTDWGTPNLPQYRSTETLSANPFNFSGDTTDVFPSAIAEFKGRNIPVQAGHYRVTFNSQTFAYSFERLDP